MASSRARYQRNIVLGLVLVFLVLLTPYVAFADNGLKIQVDSSNGATIYIRDDTSNPGGAYVEITGFTSPYTYPAAVADHQYSVYVKRDGHRLLVKNKPKDWSVDTGTGTVATGTWDGGSEAVHFSGPGTGNIIVKKETDPDGSSESFTFTPSYGSNFNLSDGGSNDSGELGSGTYTVEELVPSDWELTSIGIVETGTSNSTSSGSTASITLEAGETVTVTFNDKLKRGHIIVKKETDPDDSSESFEFSSNYGINFNLSDGDSDDSGPLLPGTYTVSELVPSDWELTSIGIVETGTSNSTSSGSTASITLEAGETVTVTFNDKLKRGHIIVKKETDPDDSSESFEFSSNYGINFNLSDGDSDDSGPLLPGTYTVSELVPSDWELTSIGIVETGTSNSTSSGSTASITLEAGETVTVTFNDKLKRGHIIVKKETDPDDSSESFEFSSNYGINFNLSDGDSDDSGPLLPGTYTVSELVPSDWELTSIGIVETGTSNSTSSGSTASITLEAGETVTVTFNDKLKRGHIIVKKETDPDDSSESFEFSSNYGINFNLSDGDSDDSGPLLPGTYTVSELVPSDWELTSIGIVETGTSNSTSSGSTASITLEAGETVTVTFNDKLKRGHIIVKKETDPDDSSESFEFSSNYGINFNLSDGDSDDSGPLLPGTYTVSELVPSDWELTSIGIVETGTSNSTSSGSTASITLEAGETVTVTFNDKLKRGHIIVKKETDPDDSSESFEFSSNYGINFNLSDGDSDDSGPLLPGTYTVSELVPSDWELTSIGIVETGTSNSTSSGSTASITLEAGETVTVTFNDKLKRGHIIVKKETDPDDSSESFEFSSNYGINFNLSDGDSDDSGPLLPGTYTVSELVPSDWELTSIGIVETGTSNSTSSGSTASITLEAGETVTVTFNDKLKRGHIIVKKETDPDDSSESFEFSSNYGINFNLSDGDSDDSGPLLPGTYTVSELVPSDWELTSIGIVETGTSNSTSSGSTASITLEAGETVTVTFNDKLKRGHIIVKKETDPDDSSESFEFSSNYGINFNLSDGDSDDSGPLLPGTYTVSELVPSDWELTSIGIVETGTSNSTSSGSTASITLEAGETVTVTFNDKLKRGHIIVKKETDPDDSSESFEFSSNYGINFNLSDGDSDDSGPLLPGTYTVSELVPSDWELTSIGIVETGTSNSTSSGSTASITLEAGETVTVTFNDKLKRGHIIVKKETDPDDSSESFEFSSNYGINFNLSDGDSDDSGPLLPGTYTVSELVPSDWELTSIGIVETGTSNSTSSGSTASITLEAGETVTVTFNDKLKRGHIIVKKETDPDDSSESFEFSSNYGINFNLSDGDSDDSGPLLPGTYTVSELVPSDWELTSIGIVETGTSNSTSSGSTASITLEAGETVTVTFNDKLKRGHIIVKKETDPDDSSESFEFSSNYGINFNLSDGDSDDSGPLLPGTYTVSELVPSDWELTSIGIVETGTSNSTSSGSTASITLEAGETVTVTFNDKKKATITVHKFNDLDGNGTQETGERDLSGWTMTLYRGLGCSGSVVTSGETDSNGDVVFTVAAGDYSVRETIKNGWQVTTPAGNPSECQAVTVSVAGTETVVFGNQQISSGIELKKYVSVDGGASWEDANQAPGPAVQVGNTVQWQYVVTNTGNVALSNITLTDDNGTPTNTSDDFAPSLLDNGDGNDVLSVGETWIYQASGTAVLGQYNNTGQVTAKDPQDNPVSHTDPSHYLGVNLKITLDPPDATNKIGDDHVITATVEVNTGGGFGPAPDGTVVDFTILTGGVADFVDATGAVIGKTTSDTTTGGTVSVTLNSSTIGSNTIKATAKLAGHANVTATTGTTGNGSNATKDYVDLKITLDPPDATNKIGDDHVITATVEVNTGGGFGPAPDGTVVDFTILTGGVADFVDATGAVIGKTTSDTTTGGTVSVTLNSSTIGSNTIKATAKLAGHANVTATTGTTGNGSNATKDYVDLKITLDPPDATNKIGDDHVITATVEVNTGGGFGPAPDGTVVDFTILTGGVADFVDATGAVIGKTTSDTTTGGTVSVTLNSSTIGSNTIKATAKLAGHANVTATTGTTGNGSNATKDYVDLKITLDPPDATNKIGDDHVITATVEVNTGGGFGPAPDGTVVDFTILTGGVADFVDATGAVIGKTTSDTTTGGTVSVTLNSSTIGSNTIKATAKLAGHANVTATTGTTGNGSNATKDYVDLKITLDPPDATNKIGDDHVITATVEVNTGGGFGPAPDGTVVDFTILTGGVADFVDATGAVIGKTTSDTTTGGTVSVTLNSSTIGSNTIKATAKLAGHANVTATTGTTGNGSNATKDYVDLKITLDPPDATNKIGDDHVITATVEVNTGGGFGPAPDGTVVDFTILTGGVADFVDATGAVIGKTTSDTTTGGTVSVTLNSSTIGSNTIKATAKLAGHANVTATTGTTGNGSNATKDYVTTGISIEKLTNGQDADAGTGPYIAVGGTVTWSYTVTNLGDTPISNVVVTDDNGTPSDPTDDVHPVFTGGDTNSANGSLDPAEIWTYQATGIATAGQYENIATVTGTPPVGGDVSDNDHSHYFGSDPRISLVKTGTLNDDDGTAGVSAGDTISYAFTVTNTGNVMLSNVTVADKVGGVTVSGGPLASLGVGASDSTTFTGSYTITQADIDAGTFTNTAEATGTPPSGPPVTDEDSDTQELTQSPAIDIEKATNGQDADSAPGPSLAVGDTITWTYVVTNTGNVTLTNIEVTDNVIGAVGTIASLAPGASQTLTKTGTAVAGQYANTGTATVIFGDTTYTDSDDSHYFGAGADLSLTKGVDNPTPNEGDTIVYTITLTNGGPSDATGVAVTDALPAGLTYVSDSGAGAYSSATNVWTVSSLTNGASVTLAITATVDAGTAGTTIANTAEVTAADQPDPDSTPNNHDPDEDDQSSVSITVQSADLVVDKTVDNPTPNEGATIVYTITITNDGPSDATGVTLTDLLPIGVTYVSDNGGGAYDSATGVWTVGSIAVGDIAVLEITATVDAGTAGTTITNMAEVTTSDQPDPDDTNNRDSADITVPEEVAGGGGAAVECEGVIINEVAWAGTAADSRDEWIELRNLGTIPVDLTGWTLRWRRKQPTTEEEYRWKVVDLSGILLPASTSACELADNDSTPFVEFIKRDTDDLSWWILGKHEDKDESYYTIERRHDETISNEEADLLYDTTEPYEMELTDLGDVIQLRNDLGEVVDTANASYPERDGWPAGSAATFATMERTDPLGPDTWENWHTNLGIITRGLDAQEQPLIATADALNSKELEELALNAELPPAKTRAGARLEVGLDLPREDRIALGWPWIRVTRPDLAEAAGGGGAVEAGAGFSFSGRYSGDLYWLGIDTGGLLPGQYNIWVVYGEGKAILVPIVVLP